MTKSNLKNQLRHHRY